MDDLLVPERETKVNISFGEYLSALPQISDQNHFICAHVVSVGGLLF